MMMTQLTPEWIQRQLNKTPDQVREMIAPAHDGQFLWMECYSSDDPDEHPRKIYEAQRSTIAGYWLPIPDEHTLFFSRREAEDWLIMCHYRYWLRKQREIALAPESHS